MSTEEKTAGQKALEYLTDHPNATAKELMSQGVSKSYAYSLIKEHEKNKNRPPEATKIKNTENVTPEPAKEEKKIEEITTTTTPEPTATPTPESKLEKGLLQTGFFEPSELKEIIQEINIFFDKEEQLPEKSCLLLGKLWAKPLNRWIGENGDQNLDIKIAAVVTVGLLAPRIVKTVQKKGVLGHGKNQQKTNPESK